jgi:hypothetical protein
MSKKRLLLIITILSIVCIFFLTSCKGQDEVSRSEATTSMRLLDVTTSAGQSGRYATSRTAESFWLYENQIIRCFHDHVDGWPNDEITLGGENCESFPRPSQLPSNAVILGINMGTSQKTQSVWDIGDNQIKVCNHSLTFWASEIDDAQSCTDWEKPYQVDSRARLASLNSGQYQRSESFWNNPDGTITECEHNRDGVGFLGIEGYGFGEVISCVQMARPQLLPVGDFVLTGVTSDNHRPMESFWQDSNGVLAQCRHEKIGEGFIFETYHLGPATDCWYWRAPQW